MDLALLDERLSAAGEPAFRARQVWRWAAAGAAGYAAMTDVPATLRALREGVELDDGTTAPARARKLAADRLELTIHEGRKHQVKRMCAAVGHPVRELERIAFGPLRLGGLEPGEHRRLTPAEVERLRSLA